MNRRLEIENFLIELIKKNKTTTYGTVCDAFGLKPLNGVWSDHPLCLIFDEIDRLDAENNRPFKTSIVLTKNGGNVGGGFYEALLKYKNISCRKLDEKLAAWTNEIKGCFAYKW